MIASAGQPRESNTAGVPAGPAPGVPVHALRVDEVHAALSSRAEGLPQAEGLLFALGMIVAFVPEGMLPTVSLSLSLWASSGWPGLFVGEARRPPGAPEGENR